MKKSTSTELVLSHGYTIQVFAEKYRLIWGVGQYQLGGFKKKDIPKKCNPIDLN